MRLIQSGPKDARIVIVGEAPGPTEVATGSPFAGGAGELLTRLLSKVGISRGRCFLTNVVHTVPAGGKFESFYTKAGMSSYMAGVVQLKKDLEAIRPNLVIALGSHALRALTGKVGIDKWRGSILESTLVPGLKVVGTYNPAYLLRVYDYKAVAEFDLRRCADEAATPSITRPARRFLLHDRRVTTAANGQTYRRQLHDGELERWTRKLESCEWLGVDIECWQRADGSWALACVGFSDRSTRALVIHNDGTEARTRIQRLLRSDTKKVYQNGTFDVTVLRNEGFEVTNFAWDTMLAHHSLFAECASGTDEIATLAGKKRQSAIAKGLAFQASVYTREPFYKDDGKTWRETGDLETFWLYNARDVAVTREIRDVQDLELDAFGVRRDFDHKMSLVEPVMRMTNKGIRIDLTRRKDLHGEIETEVDRLQVFLDTAAGSPINVKSSPQVAELLYGKLKLPAKKSRTTGNLTADKDAINELAAKNSNPVLHTILKIRERRDLIERYLKATIDADGRMRCSFDITGTRSGRLSSRASIYGSGTNLQTIPSRKKVGEQLRQMFLADEGKVLIYRDFKQAEAVVVAYLAECQGLIELFEDPTRDLHKENAARIFNKPVSQITPEERYLAKRIVHASNYGMEADKFVRVVNEDYESTGIRTTYHEARKLLEKYFAIYPEIKSNFWARVEQEVRQTRMLTTPVGWKRIFYGRMDDKLIREAYSFIPQSVVGYLGGEAVARSDSAFQARRDLDADVLLQVHDSVLSQSPVIHASEVATLMEDRMRESITIHERTFEIPTDCQVGFNWGKRSDKNPLGLIDMEKGGAEWLEGLIHEQA